MDKKLKAKWIKALNSGRYQQSTNDLKSEAGYCCLGVLRQIMHRGSGLKWKAREGNVLEYICKEHQDEAGLTKGIQTKLARMNDSGKDFPTIAAWIKANL